MRAELICTPPPRQQSVYSQQEISLILLLAYLLLVLGGYYVEQSYHPETVVLGPVCYDSILDPTLTDVVFFLPQHGGLRAGIFVATSWEINLTSNAKTIFDRFNQVKNHPLPGYILKMTH